MATVRDLLETLTKSNGEQPVLADDDKGNLTPLQTGFCVEGDTLFLDTKVDSESLTANQLKWYIECEAEDSCWKNGYGESLFLDCEVVICFGTSKSDDSDSKCCSTNAVYTGANDELVIQCEEIEE